MKILSNKQCQRFVDLAVVRLADYIRSYNLKGITCGVSGGIDSSVVAVIGLKAIEKLKSEGCKAGYDFVFLDVESDIIDFKKALDLSNKFDFKLKEISLTSWYKESPVLKLIPAKHKRSKISKGNIKARLRMITLYNSASLNNYIYLDTDDLSEHWMGFWTRHGDEGDVKIIQNVTKTELYDIGEYLGIPEIILESQPGDGLGVTESNQAIDQLGLDYLYIEYIISRVIGEGFDINNPTSLKLRGVDELIKNIAKEINKSEVQVKNILKQALKTGYKRKYGDYAANLLPDRKEFGFPEVGSLEFREKYLSAHMCL